MPSYDISGADRKTGGDRFLTIDARDEGHAYELAAEKGILVSECRLVPGSGSPMPKPSPPKASLTREGEAASAVAAVPQYPFLRLEGTFYHIIGVACLTLGGLMILFLVLMVLVGQMEFDPMLPVGLLIVGLAAFFIASIYFAISQAIYAFRDIAINSWHTRRAAEAMAKKGE